MGRKSYSWSERELLLARERLDGSLSSLLHAEVEARKELRLVDLDYVAKNFRDDAHSVFALARLDAPIMYWIGNEDLGRHINEPDYALAVFHRGGLIRAWPQLAVTIFPNDPSMTDVNVAQGIEFRPGTVCLPSPHDSTRYFTAAVRQYFDTKEELVKLKRALGLS